MNRRAPAKPDFAWLVRIASFCVLAGFLSSEIIETVAPPPKIIDMLVLMSIAVLLPYLRIMLVSCIAYYRRYENDRVKRRVYDITGARRMWILHRESAAAPKLFARGTGVLHIVLIKGNLNVLSEDELVAVIVHEIGHNKYWHYPVYLAAGMLSLYLLAPYGIAGLLFAVVMPRIMCYFMEIAADRYVYRSGVKNPFLSGVAKIETRRPGWIEYVPVLCLLSMYPKRR